MNIYIMTPAGVVTGGVELLHQLCNELNTHDSINAKIKYTADSSRNRHPGAYEKYNNPIYDGNLSDLTENDIIIYPEVFASKALSYRAKSIIYWESVDNYFNHLTNTEDQYKFKQGTIHLAQSMYAVDFLLHAANVNPSSVIYVSDYLNEEFLNQPENISAINRRKQVLYNPAKGLMFTKSIINYKRDITFIPIEKMSTKEIIQLMNESMLYIDFGDHPGKDRMPREAAICGCCVITGKNGSANFKADVNIPDSYKLERKCDNISRIYDKISNVLDNYTTCINDFAQYRSYIRREYTEFKEGVTNLVKTLQ